MINAKYCKKVADIHNKVDYHSFLKYIKSLIHKSYTSGYYSTSLTTDTTYLNKETVTKVYKYLSKKGFSVIYNQLDDGRWEFKIYWD